MSPYIPTHQHNENTPTRNANQIPYIASTPTLVPVDPNTTLSHHPKSMVTNIRTLERRFPLPRSPNYDYLKDIPNITIALGSQLDQDHDAITRWKQHRNQTIDKMKPYIISTSHILHSNILNDFCAWLKDDWAFELGFLRMRIRSVSIPSCFLLTL